MIELPCLRCGKILDESTKDYGYVQCECGAKFAEELLDEHREPGYYREWLAALACTCGNVDHYYEPEVVLAVKHRCRAGGIGMLPRPNTN